MNCKTNHIKCSLRYLSIILLILCFLSCSSRSKEEVSLAEASRATSKSDANVEEFALRILEERNDGETLYLFLELESPKSWSREAIALRYTGLRDGQAVKTSVTGGPKLTFRHDQKQSFDAGEKAELSFAIALDQATDYQLELLWGAEAKRNLPGQFIEDHLKVRNVRLERLQYNCPGERCRQDYQVLAELFNGSDRSMQRASLEIKFVGEGLDPTENSAQNAASFELPELGLAAGTARQLKLGVNAFAALFEQKAVVPQIRVKDAVFE